MVSAVSPSESWLAVGVDSGDSVPVGVADAAGKSGVGVGLPPLSEQAVMASAMTATSTACGRRLIPL
jgi:hypothetical protein